MQLEIHEILESLRDGKISVEGAKKFLSLHSIEEIEGFAKIDTGRRNRRGIPEVIFAETKELVEIKKITKRVLEKTDSVMISRIRKEDYPKVMAYAKRLGVKIKTGRNSSSSILLFKKTHKIPWRDGRDNHCRDIGHQDSRRVKADVRGHELQVQYKL